MQTDYGPNGNHGQTKPARWDHLLLWIGGDLHEQRVQRRLVVGGDRCIFAKFDQRARRGFAQDERMNHAKLDAQQDQQHPGHEVAVASEFHRSITICRRIGGVEDKSFRWP